MDFVSILFKVLLIAGALNWGSIALGGPDFVKQLAMTLEIPELDQYIKIIVGIAGLYGIYELYYWNVVHPNTMGQQDFLLPKF
jgi:uncharacterized membrane protein YuzA (DUF378 family)